jgi:uncharacterized protein
MRDLPMTSFSLLLLTLVGSLMMINPASAADATFRYYFDTAPTSLQELDTLLDDLSSNEDRVAPGTPLIIMLHGDHASVFVRDNYPANKKRVDQAALLDAFGIIDVKICATWMRLNDITEADIPPFIESVPYGVAELERLRKDGYMETTRVKL